MSTTNHSLVLATNTNRPDSSNSSMPEGRTELSEELRPAQVGVQYACTCQSHSGRLIGHPVDGLLFKSSSKEIRMEWSDVRVLRVVMKHVEGILTPCLEVKHQGPEKRNTYYFTNFKNDIDQVAATLLNLRTATSTPPPSNYPVLTSRSSCIMPPPKRPNDNPPAKPTITRKKKKEEPTGIVETIADCIPESLLSQHSSRVLSVRLIMHLIVLVVVAVGCYLAWRNYLFPPEPTLKELIEERLGKRSEELLGVSLHEAQVARARRMAQPFHSEVGDEVIQNFMWAILGELQRESSSSLLSKLVLPLAFFVAVGGVGGAIMFT